ncbi:DUF5681 domain-containing protein [uncultured Erythrobacter sp.]|uniref:DUF5681 domain-containing protein n=1 Tax=uncultured Erythrobacter sp. TaxID=263913 RepID=UPI002632C8DB|nr:DUF5681 domain-containing protein [uncultured Erythrobacter sp.]
MSDDDYEIGYGKPPKHTRFKKGHSGNPAGRPRGAKNKKPPKGIMKTIGELMRNEAERTVTISENGERIEVPIAQVILRKMAADAAKGSDRARKEFLTLALATQKQQIQERASLFEAVINYRHNAWQELERCKMLDIDPPELVPHPSNVDICMRTGAVTITGPIDVGEQRQLEKWQARKSDFEAELRVLHDELELAEDDTLKALIEENIADAESILKLARDEVHVRSTVMTMSEG